MKTLRIALAHHEWSWRRVFDACAGIPDDELDRAFEIGMGSLRMTLAHVVIADRIWLDRWCGVGGAHDEVAEPVSAIRERFEAVCAERRAYLDDVGNDGERAIIFDGRDGRTHDLALGDLLLHVCNHGIHHRAQAANMIRVLRDETLRLDALMMRMEAPSLDACGDFDPDTIAEWFGYGDWATKCVFDWAAELDDTALDAPVDMGLGTLRKTFGHLHDAEAWWVKSWRGEAGAFEQLPDTTPLDEIRSLCEARSGERNDRVAGATAEDLDQIVKVTFRPGEELQFLVGDSMLQVAGHGTYHRAQAINMLRRQGVETESIDYARWISSG